MTSRNAIVLVLIAAGVVASGGSARAAAGLPAPSVEDAVRGLVESGRDHAMRWPDLADVQATLENFYIARSWAPAWLEGARPTVSAQVTIRQLLAASDRGIAPDDLDAAHLANVASEMLHAERTPETRELAEFEVALSADALRYFSALDRGRVSPQRAHADLLIPRPSLDGVGALERLHATNRPDTVYASAEPQFVHYQMLLYALARYRAIARDSGLVPLPRLPKNLEAGDTYRGAPQLARLLTALGDLSDSLRVAWSGDSAYDAALAEGVRAFQRRHGQRPDGVLGRSTFDRLNRPFEQRLRTIELGLERWRWLPRAYDAPPIFVNVPAFRLYALKGHDDLESEMLRMNVAVGKAYGHKTPLFAESMRYLVFSPYWDVPPSIATKEIRPKALRDASYLGRQNYELVSGSSVVASSHDNIAAIGRSVRVRQRPGPKNALGTVKFIFPNHHNVYLHDTPSGGFDEPRRDFSHGCIRVSKPRALAEWVLAGQPEWTPDKIAAAMSGDRPVQVNLAEPRPVYILYSTALADEEGHALFFPDIYDLDPPLDQMLQRGFPYPQ
jgi:murein L,D-transpeptidase YcbB/YkuD